MLYLIRQARPRGRFLTLSLLLAVLTGCGGSESSGDAASGGGAEPVAVIDGEKTYTRFCFSCHAAGLAGAPKTGVAEDWKPRVAKGQAALLAATVAGVPPGMPAMGLCSSCSEAELAAAIDYMLAESGVGESP